MKEKKTQFGHLTVSIDRWSLASDPILVLTRASERLQSVTRGSAQQGPLCRDLPFFAWTRWSSLCSETACAYNWANLFRISRSDCIDGYAARLPLLGSRNVHDAVLNPFRARSHKPRSQILAQMRPNARL